MVYSNRTMRRSSLIGPWGVGAIVPFPNDESLMIAGLDKWRYTDIKQFIIKDERLQCRLGVHQLRWPPDYRTQNEDKNNCNLTIPTIRFPQWHYCPFCGTMKNLENLYAKQQPECDCYHWPNGRSCDPAKRRHRMIPERFIVICPNGHIDDFPVAEWLHAYGGHHYDKESCRIRRITLGASASLSSVMYECSCGAKRSVAAAFKPGALEKIGYKCKGSRPWLGITEDADGPCGNEDIRVVLRGATNVWFADTRSSIYIPIDNDGTAKKIILILDKYFDNLNSRRINGILNKEAINIIADSNNVDPNELYDAVVTRAEGRKEISKVNESMSEDEYRLAEYNVLKMTTGSSAQQFCSKNYSISYYDSSIRKYFKSISLVPKLQETRAFVGFSRIEPKETSISEQKKQLRLGNDNWLPAIQVHGEGIFFEFSQEKLEEWAKQSNVLSRIKNLQDSYKKSKYGSSSIGILRPEFVMIHTFAHLVINQLSFECGYGSSSIRERIYCEKTSNKLGMVGVLLYTASGDSEGSLGGLVRQGMRGHIEDTIRDAVRNAAWCSSDPVCIQSQGQGPDSCNLAACHNCALLPETCCECGNRILDRGMIVGTLDDKSIGFFSDFL